jgi:hypothetical protein
VITPLEPSAGIAVDLNKIAVFSLTAVDPLKLVKLGTPNPDPWVMLTFTD